MPYYLALEPAEEDAWFYPCATLVCLTTEQSDVLKLEILTKWERLCSLRPAVYF